MAQIIEDKARGQFLVPRRAFTDKAVFEREYEAIFNNCWLYLGHASELPNPGSFLTRTVARRPILFTRDKEGNFNALLNACPHRGALVCRERKGKSPAHCRAGRTAAGERYPGDTAQSGEGGGTDLLTPAEFTQRRDDLFARQQRQQVAIAKGSRTHAGG